MAPSQLGEEALPPFTKPFVIIEGAGALSPKGYFPQLVIAAPLEEQVELLPRNRSPVDPIQPGTSDKLVVERLANRRAFPELFFDGCPCVTVGEGIKTRTSNSCLLYTSPSPRD